MIYFSYNDYSDCKENGKIDVVKKLEENKAKYEVQSGTIYLGKEESKIAKDLRKQSELKKFYKKFLNINNQEDLNNIIYCNEKELLENQVNKNVVISKIKDKEIFVVINVLENIDNNIPYKMFEISYSLIQNWYIKEERLNKRYPIVIPVVIYTGRKKWENSKQIGNGKLNYTTFRDNEIIFSYNVLNMKNENSL